MPHYWYRAVALIVLATVLGSVQTRTAATATPPRVWAITAAERSDDPRLLVTFSEPVSGVDGSDFGYADPSTPPSFFVTPTDESGTSYRIAPDGSTWVPTSTLVLVDDDTIRNAAGMPLGGWGIGNGNAVGSTISHPRLPLAQLAGSSPRAGGIITGWHMQMALSSTNRPVFSYIETTTSDLLLSICDDLACRQPTTRSFATSAGTVIWSAVALTSADIPLVSFYDSDATALKLLRCADVTCSSATVVTVDDDDMVGSYSSIAVTSADIPVISYVDGTTQDLKLAICESIACAAPVIRRIDAENAITNQTTVAISSADIPLVSYYDSGSGDIKLALCNNRTCTAPSTTTIDSSNDVGGFNALTLTSDDVPVIAYTDATTLDPKLAICNGFSCTSPTIVPFTTSRYDGFFVDVGVSTANIPYITHYNLEDEDLELIRCLDATCSTIAASQLATAGGVGKFAQIEMTARDEYVVGYVDVDHGNLMLQRGSTIIDDGRPRAFSKHAPADAAVNQPAAVTLLWDASAYAAGYEYCISTSQTSCTNWQTAETNTTAAVSGLTNATTYYWQVRAVNGAGQTTADRSQFHRFTVTLKPVSFAKSAPTNNATNQKTTLTLSWAASSNATSYEYCIAKTAATCTTWKSSGAARTATISGLAKNTVYYWQIRAKNSAGTTLSSTTHWKFTTSR